MRTQGKRGKGEAWVDLLPSLCSFPLHFGSVSRTPVSVRQETIVAIWQLLWTKQIKWNHLRLLWVRLSLVSQTFVFSVCCLTDPSFQQFPKSCVFFFLRGVLYPNSDSKPTPSFICALHSLGFWHWVQWILAWMKGLGLIPMDIKPKPLLKR